MSKYEFTEKEDGRTVVTPKERLHGSQYGDYIKLPLNPSEKDISQAKALFVKQICEVIRQLAERDGFFIRKDMPEGLFPNEEPYTTLGWRIIFPTLTDD